MTTVTSVPVGYADDNIPDDGNAYYKAKNGLNYLYQDLSIVNRLFLERSFEKDKAESGLFLTDDLPKAKPKTPRPSPALVGDKKAGMERRHSSRLDSAPKTVGSEIHENEDTQQIVSGTTEREHSSQPSPVSSSATGDCKANAWEKHYTELVAYKNEHDTCNVTNTASKSLAKWVREQRQRKDQGELPLPQKTKLDELGFDWLTHEARQDLKWMEKYSRVKSFYEQNGDFEFERDGQLWNWSRTQRWNFRNNKLDRRRAELLKAIGFPLQGACKSKITAQETSATSTHAVWRKRNWMDHYNTLRAFYKKYGHLKVPGGQSSGLGGWKKRQREAFIAGKMKPERVKLLRAVGFNLSPARPIQRDAVHSEEESDTADAVSDDEDLSIGSNDEDPAGDNHYGGGDSEPEAEDKSSSERARPQRQCKLSKRTSCTSARVANKKTVSRNEHEVASIEEEDSEMSTKAKKKSSDEKLDVFGRLMPIIDELDEERCLQECEAFLQHFLPGDDRTDGSRKSKSRVLFLVARLDHEMDDSQQSRSNIACCEKYFLRQLEKAQRKKSEEPPCKRRKS